MKTTTKLIGILSALIVVILAVFLVTKFNSHESARVSTSSSPVKTVKKSSSSSSKAVKKDKKSAQSSTSAVSNEENDNQASAVAPVYAAPDKDSGVVSKMPAGDVDWDKYEILPDGNWYSFVKDGQRYYISYSDVGH